LLQQHAALIDIGLAYLLKDICLDGWSSDPAQAVGAAATLAAMAKHTASPEIRALADWAAGIAALTEGQMEHAITRLGDAANGFEALGKPHTAAATQVSKLIALAMLGRYDEAIVCGLHARDVFVDAGDELRSGRIELNLGNIYWRRGQHAEAEQFLRQACERFIMLDDHKELARVYSNLAAVLTLQHKFRAAEKHYEKALTYAELEELTVIQAEIEGNLGNLALFQGRYDQALDYLERSRRKYTALGMPYQSAIAELELADAYLELNLAPEAVVIYERVISIFATLGMRFEQAWALTHYGRAYVMLQQPNEARHSLSQARPIFAAEQNASWEAKVHIFEAQAYLSEGDYLAAAAAASRAVPPLDAAGMQGWLLMARWLQGEAARSLGRLEDAQRLLEATLNDAKQQMLPQIAQRCHTSLGLLAATAGDVTRAEAELQQAVGLIEELRAPLPAEEFRTAFVADKLTPYAELVQLCLNDNQRSRDVAALGYVERARSRALVDMLGGAIQALPKPRDKFEAELMTGLIELREELNWLYSQINRPQDNANRSPAAIADLQDEVSRCEAAIQEITRQIQQQGSSALIRVQPLDVAELQQDLDADTALVEYYSLNGALIAFVVTNDSIEVVQHLGCEQEVEAAVSQLRFQTDAMRHGTQRVHNHLPQLAKRVHYYLSQLYDMLLRPLEAHIAERRLVVIPHRTLHYVPFHALYDGNAYVIEQREVCYAPSASVLHHCLARSQRPFRQALLLGVPDAHAPRVRDEVVTLATLFPKSTLLLENQATLPALQWHAPEADLVHLACHGQFRPDNPLFSALRLGDGWLTVRDAYGLELQDSLVTLSACETGVSAIAPGDELIGLARGFFSAGASTLLVSLWTVDDETTAELMYDFYIGLRAGQRPATALRNAQRTHLARHPHPFFWSPFMLLGRW
jgi:CHAT domain-containing protein